MTDPMPSSVGDRPPIDPAAMRASYPPPPPPNWGSPPPPAAPPVKSWTGRIVTSMVTSILVISLLLNLYLGAIVFSQFRGPIETVYQEGDLSSRIVIVPVNDMIIEDTAKGMRAAFKSLRENKPKAVILRVDSGGGTVGASDRIHHELVKFMEETKIPVVASFGSLAASGGYYISASCDYIMAENTTVTGSIGVMAQAFTVEGLLQKVGVTPEVHVARTSPRKDVANDIMRSWNAEDRKVLLDLLDHSHARFIDVVFQGRQKKNLTKEQVAKLADGSIYNTDEAIANGLVDEKGYLDAAIDKAAQLAGLSAGSKPQVTVMTPPKPFSVFSMLMHRGAESELPNITGSDLRNAIADLATPRLEYRMPPLR